MEKKRYFVGHRVEGKEVNEYYLKITAEMAEKFGVKDLGKRVAPHLTLKPPFETDKLGEFEVMLEHVAAREKTIQFAIDGFGKFDNDHGVTIFLAIAENIVMQEVTQKIADKIIDFGQNRNQLPNFLKLHVSIARYLEPDQASKIWEYLHSRTLPKFECFFNNLTIFENWEKGWRVYKTFKFS